MDTINLRKKNEHMMDAYSGMMVALFVDWFIFFASLESDFFSFFASLLSSRSSPHSAIAAETATIS